MARSDSTTSTEESDDQEESIVTNKRSYDCTFCKRGFTNARALGGHMNIHRKERTNYKAKQSTPNSSPFVPLVSNQPSTYYNCCILEPPMNYDMYIQPSITNPRDSPPTFQYDFLDTNSQSLLGNNLSLQIGSGHHEGNDHVWRGMEKDGEGVDLELRLGHDSYSSY